MPDGFSKLMKIKELWQLEHEAIVRRDRMSQANKSFGRFLETALIGIALILLVFFGYSGLVSPTLYDAMADLTAKLTAALRLLP